MSSLVTTSISAPQGSVPVSRKVVLASVGGFNLHHRRVETKITARPTTAMQPNTTPTMIPIWVLSLPQPSSSGVLMGVTYVAGETDTEAISANAASPVAFNSDM